VEAVNNVWYKQDAVIVFHVARVSSLRNIHKCVFEVYGCAVVKRSAVGCWA
jgi:hypothetical protein